MLITYTSFLDILGFSSKINTNITNNKKAKEFKNAFKDIIDYLYTSKKEIFTRELSLTYKIISDTIVLQLKVFEDKSNIHDYQKANAIYMLSLAIGILQQFFMLKFNIFLRGGITDKYTNINTNFLLGEGISIAHKLESEKAKVPRIIFDKGMLNDNLLSVLINAKIPHNTKIILQDTDKYYYINYLNSVSDLPIQKHLTPDIEEIDAVHLFYKKHKDLIENEIMQSLDINVTLKYIWLKQYHNYFIDTNNFDINLKIL